MSEKAQSSISTGQNPKIITPNNELVGLKKSEEQKEVTKEKQNSLNQLVGGF